MHRSQEQAIGDIKKLRTYNTCDTIKITLTLQKLVIEEIWNRKHKRAISTKCPCIFYVNVTPAIEIQKLLYVRKLTKLIAASSRAIRTFSLNYHKNFFLMREWLCRSRKRRKRILRIRKNFKQISFLARKTYSLMHEKELSMHRNRA